VDEGPSSLPQSIYKTERVRGNSVEMKDLLLFTGNFSGNENLYIRKRKQAIFRKWLILHTALTDISSYLKSLFSQ
jgi:hypothetical protein